MNKKKVAAERHWIMKTAKLNRAIYFKNILTSKWKLDNMSCCGRGYAFVSMGNKNLWIPSRLVEIRFDRGRHHEYLGDRHGGGSKKIIIQDR